MGLFKIGFTVAAFRVLGKQPVVKEVLISWVRKGTKVVAL